MKHTPLIDLSLIISLIISLMFVGLSSSLSMAETPLTSHPEHASVMRVLDQNFQAMRDKDLTRALATLSHRCATYQQSRQVYPEIFKLSLRSKHLRREVLSISPAEALVEEEVEVFKTQPNAQFRDNATVTRSKLVKESSGGWKICETAIVSVTYLDGLRDATLRHPLAHTILEAAHKNDQATASRDITSVLKTISDTCASKQWARANLPKFFKDYDLKYDFLARRVLSIDQEQGKAKVLATTRARRAKGATIPFKANITTSESELTLDADGVWRLCSTKVVQIKYLDEP